jgi:hypothetical protein
MPAGYSAVHFWNSGERNAWPSAAGLQHGHVDERRAAWLCRGEVTGLPSPGGCAPWQDCVVTRPGKNYSIMARRLSENHASS